MTRILRNARRTDGTIVDLAVADGRITAVTPAGTSPVGDTPVDDLGNWLVVPALVEPHAHLDKALTAEIVPNPKGDLLGAIEAWIVAAAAGRITHEGTVERAHAAMELLLVHGVTAVRTHVNVLGTNGTAALRAVKEAATRFEGLLDVQTVALTSSPMTGPDSGANRAALDAAIEEGVDLVGGCPHLDPDAEGLIANAIRVATDAGVGIDLHVDDPGVLTLRELARQVIDSGFAGSVSASHCVTLGMQSPATQTEVARLVAEAGISVFPLPQTNLFLQGRDHPTAPPRGLTAVAAAVTVFGFVVVDDGDTSRMTDFVCDVAFPEKSFTDGVVAGELTVQHLDRHSGPVSVGRSVHRSHAPDAQQGIETVFFAHPPAQTLASPLANLSDAAGCRGCLIFGQRDLWVAGSTRRGHMPESAAKYTAGDMLSLLAQIRATTRINHDADPTIGGDGCVPDARLARASGEDVDVFSTHLETAIFGDETSVVRSPGRVTQSLIRRDVKDLA